MTVFGSEEMGREFYLCEKRGVGVKAKEKEQAVKRRRCEGSVWMRKEETEVAEVTAELASTEMKKAILPRQLQKRKGLAAKKMS